MYLNKMSRTSSRNIGPQHKKYSSIFNCTHGVLFIPVFTKHILSVCCKKKLFFLFHLTMEASPIWSSSRVWQLNMLEFVIGWVRIIFLETLPNNMWCRRCLTIFKKGFLTQRLNYFQQFSSCGPWRVFSHSNSPSRRALGRYRHTSSSWQIHNISCIIMEILNYCPDDGNGNFHCSSSSLKATSLICEAQLSFAAHQKCILWFFSLWWMIKGIWTLFSLLFIFLWNRKPRLDNFMFIIPMECSTF